jgi:hypothetical protein
MSERDARATEPGACAAGGAVGPPGDAPSGDAPSCPAAHGCPSRASCVARMEVGWRPLFRGRVRSPPVARRCYWTMSRVSRSLATRVVS